MEFSTTRSQPLLLLLLLYVRVIVSLEPHLITVRDYNINRITIVTFNTFQWLFYNSRDLFESFSSVTKATFSLFSTRFRARARNGRTAGETELPDGEWKANDGGRFENEKE